jgi:uncharacterized RDD family membrane protein YckC
MSHAAHGPDESPVPRRAPRAVAVRVHGATREAAHETRYEGLVTRGIAFAIDAAVINLTSIVVAGAVALALSVLSVPDWLGPLLLALAGALYLAWSVGYFVVFWSTTGQTPGCRLMRIRVCRADDDGTLTPRRAALRVIFLTLAAIPLLAGFLPILLDDRRRGLHDMLAGTVVVEAPEDGLTRPEVGV